MTRPAAVALAALAVALPALAQSRPSGTLPSLEDVTKDMEKIDAPKDEAGLMTFYRYKANDPTKDQTRLLAVVPRSLLKQDLLFAVNISRGNEAGWQYLDGLVRWEQVGRQLALVAPDTRFIDKPTNPINDALRRTYRPSYILTVPIVATSGGDLVADLSDGLFGSMFGGPPVPIPGGGGRVRRDISRIDSVKAFKDNVVVDVDYALGGSSGATTVGLSYAFRRLPSGDGYRPRVADERVGYFQTTRQDWTTKYDARESTDRFVNRWDLRKKDPSLEMSPPEKPITFVIDKSVPYQWRKYVADGILEWNKAFEKCGIINAVVVQQQTDDNEFADIDPADCRYNFIQWTVRNIALAVGPSRADPRTGQILDADIVIDDAWIRYFNRAGEAFSPKTVAALFGPGTLKFLENNPQFLPPGVTAEALRAERDESADLMKSGEGEPASPLRPARRDQCELAVGMVQQLAVAQGLFEQVKGAGLPKIPDNILGNALKQIVSHEVGHTLGLRHNFKASSWLSLDDIRKHRDNNEPFVSSVMDYTPLAFFADDDLKKIRSFSSDSIGPYDYWAIQYGYGSPKDGQNEQAMLKEITSQSAKKENAYATDEDTMGLVSSDPLTNRYDLSDSPLAWAESEIKLTDKLLTNITEWAAKPDEPNHYLRQTFLQLTSERSKNLAYVSRLVGGQYFSRSHRSDPGAPEPITPVAPKLQRDAIALIGRTVLSADFYKPAANLMGRLPPSRWWDGGEDESDFPQARVDFPYSRYAQSQYEMVLMALASPETLQRVYDAEARSDDKDKMTAAEMIRTVRDTVWSEIADDAKAPTTAPTDAAPLIRPERRGMQATHLKYLLAAADAPDGLGISPDLKNQVRFALRELSDRITGRITGAPSLSIDFATKAHLTEAKSKIDRTLDKPLNEGGGGQRIIILGAGQKPPAE